MDGYVDGGMDGWFEGRSNGWMDELLGECI